MRAKPEGLAYLDATAGARAKARAKAKARARQGQSKGEARSRFPAGMTNEKNGQRQRLTTEVLTLRVGMTPFGNDKKEEQAAAKR